MIMAHIRYKGKSKVIIRLCELVNDLYERTFGDMVKEVYDRNDNGIVDNAEKVNNHNVYIDVPADAKFTDTVYDDTIIRDRVTYLMNISELIMQTLFESDLYYLKDSEDYIIVDSDGFPLYTAQYYDRLSELARDIRALQSQKYLVWGDPEPDPEQSENEGG